jgi:enoyl-CoA hydratase
MQYEHLLVENREGIVLITLNRPRALNAINSAMMEELRLIFSRDLREQPAIRGVIVTGAGDKAFAAGADITELLALTPVTVEAFVRKGHEAYDAIERFPRPVIAAIDGYALGGGCELAMACHLRLATPQSRFGQPEVNLGIIPGYGGTQRLVQLIGKARALELLMTGDLIDAETALRYGLINDLVGPGEAINKATDLIRKISTKGPLAVEKIITTVQAYFDKNDNGFEREIQGFCDLSATEDFREGSAAFLEKRKANFTGQ